MHKRNAGGRAAPRRARESLKIKPFRLRLGFSARGYGVLHKNGGAFCTAETAARRASGARNP